MPDHPVEKRAHVRVSPDPKQPTRVQIVGHGSGGPLRAQDISIGGLGVEVSQESGEAIAPDTEIELLVSLPGREPFTARGIVRHLVDQSDKTVKIGVQFTQIKNGDLGQIVDFVALRSGT